MVINNNLNVFLSVAEHESFTKAAGDLHISQPAVSKAISALEDELCVQLFWRSKRNGLILTDAGHQILVIARQMKQLEDNIRQTANRANQMLEGTLRIASMPITSTMILSEIVPIFQKKYPHIQVDIFEGTNWEVKQSIETYKAEIGFAISPFDPCEYMELFCDSMVAVLPPDISTPKCGYIDLISYKSPLLFGKAAHEVIADNLKKRGKFIQDARVYMQCDTVLAMVKNGCGTGILSKAALDTYSQNLRTCPIHPQVDTKYGVITHDFSQLSPAAKSFFDMIQNWQKNKYSK